LFCGIISTNALGTGDAAAYGIHAQVILEQQLQELLWSCDGTTTAASGFAFGIDLKIQDPVLDAGGPSSVQPYKKANIRMENDVVFTNAAGVPATVQQELLLLEKVHYM
jgi:hypothetical protein